MSFKFKNKIFWHLPWKSTNLFSFNNLPLPLPLLSTLLPPFLSFYLFHILGFLFLESTNKLLPLHYVISQSIKFWNIVINYSYLGFILCSNFISYSLASLSQHPFPFLLPFCHSRAQWLDTHSLEPVFIPWFCLCKLYDPDKLLTFSASWFPICKLGIILISALCCHSED